MPGCIMTQELMDLTRKEFPFGRFGQTSELVSLLPLIYHVAILNQSWRSKVTAAKRIVTLIFSKEFTFTQMSALTRKCSEVAGLHIIQWCLERFEPSALQTEHQLPLDDLTRDQISGLFTPQLKHSECNKMSVVFQFYWYWYQLKGKSFTPTVNFKRQYTEGWFSSEEMMHLWLLVLNADRKRLKINVKAVVATLKKLLGFLFVVPNEWKKTGAAV